MKKRKSGKSLQDKVYLQNSITNIIFNGEMLETSLSLFTGDIII